MDSNKSNKVIAMEMKLELILDKLHDIDITLAENTKSLIIHEKRTDLAERRIETMNERIDELKDRENEQFEKLGKSVEDKFSAIEEKILPIKNHIEVLDKVFGLMWKVIIPSLAAVVGALYKFGIISIGSK